MGSFPLERTPPPCAVDTEIGAGVVSLAYDGHFLCDGATGKLHSVNVAVFVDPDLQPLTEGIDN